jgi:hypothetical protein
MKPPLKRRFSHAPKEVTMSEEIKHIMLAKLAEMSETDPSDCESYVEYAEVCNAMNNIAAVLLEAEHRPCNIQVYLGGREETR